MRRVEWTAGLLKKFKKNPCMIKRAVFQDESDFPLEIPLNSQNDRVYFKGQKEDVPAENLFYATHGVCCVDLAWDNQTDLCEQTRLKDQCKKLL